MLAYVFWHRPSDGVDVSTYEDAQRAFHDSLDVSSASFRVAELPFANGGGYEDWYLVQGWQELGELNETAIDPARRPHHDHAASMSANGWGGVYSLVRGTATVPSGVEWLDKPRGEPSEKFVSLLRHDTVWRRQLVLGPAPDF